MHKTEDGQKYIEADVFIIPLTVKDFMQSMNILQPPEHRLQTCDQVHLTRKLPCNPKSVNQQELTQDEYNTLVSQAEYHEVCSANLKKQIRRMIDTRMSYCCKFNHYSLYPVKDLMKDIIQHNTRAVKIIHSVPMRKHHKSRNPLLT